MPQFIIRRIIQMIPILFGVSLITFGMVHVMPGNIADNVIPQARRRG